LRQDIQTLWLRVEFISPDKVSPDGARKLIIISYTAPSFTGNDQRHEPSGTTVSGVHLFLNDPQAVRLRKAACRGGYSEDTPTLKQFAVSWQSRDETASLPQLHIVTVYDPMCLLDGILIITVFDIFSAPNATVVADGVDAIFGHAATRRSLCNRAADQRVAWWAKRQLGVVGYPRNPPFESDCFARHAGSLCIAT
jgi:hypothetical protein